MRCAVIDIGSNTFKICVFDAVVTGNTICAFNAAAGDNGGHVRLNRIFCESAAVGLINYSMNNRITDEGIGRLIETLMSFRRLAREVGAETVYCIAAAGLRGCDNALEITALVKTKTGLDIELLGSENEALLSFGGLCYGLGRNPRTGVMADVGGGNTELLGFIDGLAVRTANLPFGCVSLYRRYVREILPDKDELQKIRKTVEKAAGSINWLDQYGSTAYFAGGAGRALGRLCRALRGSDERDKSNVIKVCEIRELEKLFVKPGSAEVRMLIDTVPDRLYTAVPGIVAYGVIAESMGVEDIVISECGLREGYLLKRLNG